MTKLLIAAALLAHTSLAFANSNETAESAFKRAQAALKAGRIHEACEAFEASAKLEATIETELGLASCYAQDGKPVAAARLYRGVAERDTNAARRQTSIAKAAKLEANAPKLRFAISPTVKGLVIKVDGVEVPSSGDVLVDQGPHEVVATAPGYEGRASAPVDRDRVILDVIVRMEPVVERREEPAAAPTVAPIAPAARAAAPLRQPASPDADDAERTGGMDRSRRNGLLLGAGGVALLAGAAVMFELSTRKFDEEHALCPMSRCANEMVLAEANSLLSEGRTRRGVSIGMGIGSGVLLIAGTYLFLTPNKQDTRMSFQIQPGGAAIGYTARF
ncbi:MAG TPA: hypothetical protein VIV11_14045 [Kofleriaceae bacterium]